MVAEVLQASCLDHLVRPCWDLLGRPFPARVHRDHPAASDLAVEDPNLAASSAVDIRRGPFPEASGAHPGVVRVGVVDLAIRAVLVRVVPSVVPFDRGAEGPGDVAACAVVAAQVVLLRVVPACGVAGVAPVGLPVPEEARSCAGAVREGSEVEVRRVAEEGDLALACGHPVHPEVVQEDRADEVVPDRVPYGEDLVVVRVAVAGTDCAATGKGRDSATVVPSGSELVAAALDC